MDDRVEAEIETLFRRESGRLISVLTRIFGPHNLQLAEDILQEAFVAAMKRWASDGIPVNPSAWLLTAARHRAIDAIRRERTARTFADDLSVFLDSEWTLASTVSEAFDEDLIRDDQLRMIFMCCHHTLSLENRVTLILKTLCGFSVPAIARALLVNKATIDKRLYRTRQGLKGVQFTLPQPEEQAATLDTVHAALYLLFNEGHMSTTEKPVLQDMCREAMLLVDEPALSNSDTVALLALMCFNAARLDSRIDGEGRLVPLDQQDRTRWDRALIAEGFSYLNRSSHMEAVAAGRYHLESAIAARHCTAETFEQTDWASICNLYDRLLEVLPSPVARLNRAVAISYRDDAVSAIPLVENLHREGALPHGHSIAAVLANLYTRADRPELARTHLKEALARAQTEHERDLIQLQVERAATLE